MIIENLQRSDIQTIGDIQQIKASIDVKNIEFITTLLSSNLYSQPVKSFLREIVSNAWDSHVEAGTTNEPVLIIVNDDNISIRDYGTGLSKEDFEELYCKIGSSSKRESNAYIGAFGLGHLSPLAVSDIVYVTSYYNHIARNYVMIKENGVITTNYLGENNTEEANGLLVSVPMSSSKIDKAKTDLVSLAFFPNIFVKYNSYIPDTKNLNKAKVTRYKHFSVCDLLKYQSEFKLVRKLWVLLGNVLYPLDISKLNLNCSDEELSNLNECNICVNVNIGDINVTPNRESIIYSEQTIKLLTEKVKLALEEINSLVDALSIKNTDDIDELYKNISSRIYYHPLTNTIDGNYPEGINCNIKIYYNNKLEDDLFYDAVKTFGNFLVPGFKNIYSGDTLYTERGMSYILKCNSKVTGNRFIAVENNKPLSGYTRKFIKEHGKCYNIPIINTISEKQFISELVARSPFRNANATERIIIDKVCSIFYEKLKSKTTIITEKEINDYRDVIKSNTPKEDRFKDNSLYALYEVHTPGYPCLDSTKIISQATFDYIITRLQKAGKLILHNGKGLLSNEQAVDYRVLKALGYKIFWVSNKLYSNIIKYKARFKDSKKCSNIFTDYKSILENPTKNIECKIVINRFLLQTLNIKNDDGIKFKYKHFNNVYKLIHYNIDTKYIEAINKVYYSDLNSSELKTYYKDYEVQSTEAKYLEKYFDEISILIDKYQVYLERLSFHRIDNNNVKDIIARYLLCKYLMKNKHYFNIMEYQNVKRSELIKLLYE